MTSKKFNYELISFSPAFNMDLLIDKQVDRFRSFPGNREPHDFRLHTAAELIYVHHLGFSGVPPIEEFLHGGLDTALDYFLGPPRERDRREELWYQPLRDGLMLGMLSERWDDVARLCGWVRADRAPEYCGPIDPQIPQLYILIAGAMRDEPLERSDEGEASIAKARTKRPRVLLEAWQAAREGDQTKFDSAMKESLKRFSSKQSPEDGYIGERIARVDTAVCLAAMRLGLKFPDLPEKLAARIVTRKSLRLEI